MRKDLKLGRGQGHDTSSALFLKEEGKFLRHKKGTSLFRIIFGARAPGALPVTMVYVFSRRSVTDLIR